MDKKTMIDAENITKAYGGVQVLRGVSLALNAGDVTGLFGPNGAGKSTLMNILALVSRPDGGAYRINGTDAFANARVLRRDIGFVPQDIALFEELTVLDNLTAFSRLGAREAKRRAAELCERLSLTDVRHKRVMALSGGTKRRVNLAVALLNEPRALILDEPLVGVDISYAAAITQLIKELAEKGAAVLISGHSAGQLLPLCTGLMVLKNGKTAYAGGTTAFMNGFTNPEEALLYTLQAGGGV